MATEQGAIDSDSSDSNQMKIVDPASDVSPPPPQSSESSSQSHPSSSLSSQILNVSTPDPSTTQDQLGALASTKPQETSDIANIKNNSIASESTKIDDQPELLTNSADEMVEMQDTENGISNHGGSPSCEISMKPKSQGKKRPIDEVTRDQNEPTIESAEKKLAQHHYKNDKRQEKDDYCWICHKEKGNNYITCKSCPRSYHRKCLPPDNSASSELFEANKNCANNSDWICIECSAINKSEDLASKSSTLSHLNPHDFSELLMFAVQTIKATADRSFHQPVSDAVFPDYRSFIKHPMDFSTIERNIRSKVYKSTDSLMADIKYIVHNCYIYNSPNHPLTKNANYFLKVAKNEMQEIEICFNCFRNFYTFKDKDWFTEPCARPHILVYAKMRGYPPWPAKVVRYDKEKNEVDVRFFGAHDRSWVPVEQCSLLTKPNSTKSAKGSGKGQKNSKYDSALNELALHVKRLNELFPFKFHYAKSKQPINVNKLYICDGLEDEEMSSLDDDRDSDLNEDKLVIDETGDDLEIAESDGKGLKSEKVESSSELSPSPDPPTIPEKPVKSEAPIPKLTIPKSIKIPLRSPQVQQQQSPQQPNASPKKDETPKSVKKKTSQGKVKKDKEKVENEKTPLSVKKSGSAKKKVPVKVEENESTKIFDELEALRKKYEFEKMMHKEQLKEIEHNQNLKIREMRESWQKENERALKELTTTLEEKYRKEIEETKKKLWCSECLKEAMYFCCWNTSYCSLDCQKAQWPKHASKCQQQSHWQQTNSQSTANQQQYNQSNQQQPQLQTASINNNTSTTSYNSTVN
ncbi:protein kinase C-binding protein 1 [Tetranychus urticae]|nr:protein kinase C-binding protein 1 [Tetranychus urticae]XP_025017895.1 protein kinase C-binding protein 1 [Tetranychus urticae]